MKRLSAIFVVMLLSVVSYACPVCEKRQPKVLRGITHGGGPDGNLDYFIVWGMVLIVLVTLYFSLKFLIFPKENNAGHIKRLVID